MQTLSQKLREYLQDLAAQRDKVGNEAKAIGQAPIPLITPNSERTGFYSYLDRFLLHTLQIKKHLQWYTPQSLTPQLVINIHRHRQRTNPIEQAIDQAAEIPLPDHRALLPYLLLAAQKRACHEYVDPANINGLAGLTRDFLFAGSNLDNIDILAFLAGAKKGIAYEAAFRDRYFNIAAPNVYLPDFFPTEPRI